MLPKVSHQSLKSATPFLTLDAALEHHFEFGQKVFQVGENSSIGAVTWGLGAISGTSHRTLLSELADKLSESPPKSMAEVAEKWSRLLWDNYTSALPDLIRRYAELQKKKDDRSPEESNEYFELANLGFCGFAIGGYVSPNRKPQAFEVSVHPGLSAPPAPRPIPSGTTEFWGWPNLINRLIWGVDERVFDAILETGKWSGTDDELAKLLLSQSLLQPTKLPIREAIDWVHASIYTTIKAMTFSHFAPYCGGPIEIAVISSDRRFRWVRHKSFDAAIENHHGSRSRIR